MSNALSLSSLVAHVSNLIGLSLNKDSIVPAGTVLDFAGATAPTGYLMCYGQDVSRTTYANLFTALGTTHGAGDGSTTFTLPDCRGRAIAGKDDMGGTAASRLTSGGAGIVGTTLGASGGTQTHTLTSAQIPAHTHGITDPGHSHTANGQGISGVGAGAAAGSAASWTPTTVNANTTGITVNANTGGGGAHPNVQPTLVLNKIIKT